MESQTKSQHSQPVKLALGAAIVVATVAALYLTVGGTPAGLLSKIKHPFDPVAFQVEAEMGYSNPALIKQLKADRAELLKNGIEAPTYYRVSPWGLKDQELDEFVITEIDSDGKSYSMYAQDRIYPTTVQFKIKAKLVGKDGCGDVKLNQNGVESKLCLAQDEEIIIPVRKSAKQIKSEIDEAKRITEANAKRKSQKPLSFGF